VIYICKRNQEDAQIFINDLIQLYDLRYASNIQKFVIIKTVQAALRYFIMCLYKQSSR